MESAMMASPTPEEGGDGGRGGGGEVSGEGVEHVGGDQVGGEGGDAGEEVGGGGVEGAGGDAGGGANFSHRQGFFPPPPSHRPFLRGHSLQQKWATWGCGHHLQQTRTPLYPRSSFLPGAAKASWK